MRVIKCFLSTYQLIILSSILSLVWAAKTEPGQETIWDQIMAVQAARNLQEGGLLMQQGRYDEAVREFSRAVVTRPEEAWGHIMLGAAYYWSGQVDSAMKEYREAVRLDAQNSQAHQLLGIAYAWKGDVEMALQEFMEAKKISPDRADIQMDLGSVYESMGDVSQALRHFREAVRLDKSHPLYHFQLGLLYSRLGRDQDALEAFEAALKEFPQYEDALLEVGAAWERLGDLKKAIQYFRKAVRLKPKDGVARFRLGIVYLREGDFPKASEVFREAFRLSPEGREGQLGLSMAYSGKQTKPESSAGDTSSAGTGPLETLKRNLERISLDREAKVEVDLAYTPRSELVSVRPGESRLKNALESTHKIPDVPRAMGVRRQFVLPAGNSQQRQSQVNSILRELEAIQKEAPPDSDVRMAMNIRSHDPSEGRASVSYQPRDVGNDLGLWVMGTGWMDLVHEVLPDLSASSTDWRVASGLGYVLMGEPIPAQEAFSEALSKNPGSVVAYLGRGAAYVIAGDEEGAKEVYRKVLEIDPKNKIARQNLKWLGTPSKIK
ncbi:MAG: tetratricopeptide repeat protein [Elusimicrobia bacterium]|nr:tetratricopeptide repeat protein [Elusimicrobiota bacterium]